MSGEDQQQNQPQNQQQPVQVSIPHGYQIKKHVQFKLADDKEPLQKVNNEDGSVGELFYVEKVKPDGQPKLGPDDQPILYLEKPHASDKQAQGLIEALSTALYGLIGPPNSAAKARVREAPESDDDSKITVVTKYAQRYRHVEERDCVATQTNLTVHLVMQYLFEDADLNCGNLLISSDNPKQTIRIDLGWSLADFGGLYSWGKTNFTGRPNKSNNHLFPISPLDLARFPNYIIAKPYNVFYFNKKTAESTAVLQQMSEDPAFTKTAHQYFLKALLFDKTLLDPVTHAFMLNGDDKSTVGDYLKDRFAALQRALMQVPAFRKNVCDDKIFSEYEENILAEFAAYNQEYENKLAKD
ncbi:MAG TPA: hypothetical protein VI522_03285, partial [Gammaproteobacteria bacterium]|nr:hypothetical protein [Gammaproteobacteria bacterium]